MKVKINIIDDRIVTAKIEGAFSIFEDGFDVFAKEMSAYSKMGMIEYIFDMSKTDFIDSSGIGLILRLASVAMKNGRRMCIVCDNVGVQRVMVVSNVNSIIQYVDSVQDGLDFMKSAVTAG